MPLDDERKKGHLFPGDNGTGRKDDTVTRRTTRFSPPIVCLYLSLSPLFSGNDHATHAAHGHRPDAEEGARVEVHVQSCDGEGENLR